MAATVEEGADPVSGLESLTDENRTSEEVYLGLRTTDGLPIRAVEREAIQPWIDAGWANLGARSIAVVRDRLVAARRSGGVVDDDQKSLVYLPYGISGAHRRGSGAYSKR